MQQQERGQAPLCACGCGESVKWGRALKAWNRYVVGHHIRLLGRNPNRVGRLRGEQHHMRRAEERAKLSGFGHWTKRAGNEERAARVAASAAERMRGEQNPRWNDGRTARRPSPRVVSVGDGQMLEHRFVMEQLLGRELHPMEVVHHVDDDNRNNAVQNLHLFHCQACHQLHHAGRPLAYIYADYHV